MLVKAYSCTGKCNFVIYELQITLDKSDNKNQSAQNIMGLCLAK